MTTDFRALCAELVENLERYQCWYIEDNGYGIDELEALLDRADAALSQPEPQGPTGRPAIKPVPVAERLPGLGDCDAEGRCWMFGKVEGDWRLINTINPGLPKLSYCFSHWLPHHALPVPQQEAGRA